MVRFTALLERFDEMGEKTGWTYLRIPEAQAVQLAPGTRKSFRVRGTLDAHAIRQVAVMPWGDGSYILAVNAAMRKGIGKVQGSTVVVALEHDDMPIQVPPELLEALTAEPDAQTAWEALAGSHRNYFIRWIGEAKGADTKAWRIAATITSLLTGRDFGTTIRALKAERAALKQR